MKENEKKEEVTIAPNVNRSKHVKKVSNKESVLSL